MKHFIKPFEVIKNLTTESIFPLIKFYKIDNDRMVMEF